MIYAGCNSSSSVIENSKLEKGEKWMYIYGDFIWVILAVSLIAAGQKIEVGDRCQCKKFK